MIKVLITDKLAKEGIDLLNSKEGVEAVVKTGVKEDELAKIIGEYDGLIVRSDTKVTAKVLSNPGRLKGIARAGVGVDNIDVPAATRKGILVMNTPGGNTLSARGTYNGVDIVDEQERRPSMQQPQIRRMGPQEVHGKSAQQ